MNIFCVSCSSQLHPFYNFCPICGAQAPARTISPNVQNEKITNGIFCPHCGVKNINDALFCSSCGNQLYENPTGKIKICPRCAEKNKIESKFCFNCKQNFFQWFAMKGDNAKKFGYIGSFTLFETMTGINYNLIKKDKVTLGRKARNDIIIPSWQVSARHCEFNIKTWQLTDLDSLNGTYVNRNSERIKDFNIKNIDELNIASVFTFTAFINKNLFILRLTAVLDESGIKKSGNLEQINKLRSHYFILTNGDCEINIRKMDGEVLSYNDDPLEYYSIQVKNNNYYFTDIDRGIDNKLLLHKHNKLPVNWKIKFLNQ